MKIVLILCIVLFSVSGFDATAQYKDTTIDPDKKYAAGKVAKYNKLKRRGLTVLTGGLLATGIGVGLIATAETYTDPFTGQTYYVDNQPLYGILSIVFLGIPITTTGTILSIIGAASEKSYLRKLDRLNASYMIRSGAHGIRLTYNF